MSFWVPCISLTRFLLCLLLVLDTSSETLEILHDGDIFGRFGPVDKVNRVCYENTDGCIGGVARVVTTVKERRAKQNDQNIVLYLNTGGICGGTVLLEGRTVKEKWDVCGEFLKMLNPDAMALGLTELRDDLESLGKLQNFTQIPFLTSIQLPGIENIVKQYIIITRGRLRIAIIGYIHHKKKTELPVLYNAFVPLFQSHLEKVLHEVKQDQADIVIALGYSTLLYDEKSVESNKGTHIVVSGSSAAFMYNGRPPDNPEKKPDVKYPLILNDLNGDAVYVVHSTNYTRYVGKLTCNINKKKKITSCSGNQIYMGKDVKEDKDTLDLYKKHLEKVTSLKKLILGQSEVELNAENAVCRYEECNFGNMITDAYVSVTAYLSEVDEPFKAYIALVASSRMYGSLKTDRDGKINMFELLDAYRTGSNMTILRLNGRDLRMTLELAVMREESKNRGEFLQVSGLQFTIDPHRPKYRRIRHLKVRVMAKETHIISYEDFKNDEKYSVITNYDLSQGSDSHSFLRNSILPRITLYLTDLSVIKWYLNINTKICIGVENRITKISSHRHKKCGSSHLSPSKISLIIILMYKILMISFNCIVFNF